MYHSIVNQINNIFIIRFNVFNMYKAENIYLLEIEVQNKYLEIQN